IGAAIAVLRDKPAPPPFSILDKKEALLMLTHFVGDLHQPLHVASAYLDADGRFVDPDVRTRSIRRPRPTEAIPSRIRTRSFTPNGTTSRPTSATPGPGS